MQLHTKIVCHRASAHQVPGSSHHAFSQPGEPIQVWLASIPFRTETGTLPENTGIHSLHNRLGGFYGLGKHIWSLGPYEMRQITIITFAYVFIYAWSVCIIKFSILALYRRIFGLSYFGYFCIGLTTGYLITNHIVLPLYTRPLHYYWNQWYGDKGVVQVDEAKFYLGVGIINLFGDVCILTIPIASVLKLHMGRTQKVAVCLTFLLGSFVCFASLYRIITITHLVQSKDISWAKSDVFIWSSVEPSIGIISGCLPTLRPLMMKVINALSTRLPSSFKSSQHSESSGPSLNPLETISKKRTRKINLKDTLGDTINNDTRSQWGKSRLDEDEMCLTTTTVHGECPGTALCKEGSVTTSELSQSMRRERGITMTKEFAWDEGTHDQSPDNKV
ncbi:uncharacterized protein J4E79_009565 [Alternaria viburni]|uniref:uncharacterized protein n=1 Tax=Alternaria viburni TaxID=566460 RepID=UPI0020C3C8C2|nr:uncharacterized protein J4E79_009565 [Alternaria viburni]KAI4650296.1 hypothetical protein J4E79_009565 [Alternaria viburni]